MTCTSLSRWSSGFDVLANTISFPSGDHLGSLAPLGKLVKTNASPPAIASRQSCGGSGLPSFSVERVKARYFPSGDQRGEESRSPFVRRWAGSVPEVGTIQIDVLYPSFFSFTVTRTNATRLPSGETWASPTQTKSKRSFSVIRRLSAAKAGRAKARIESRM